MAKKDLSSKFKAEKASDSSLTKVTAFGSKQVNKETSKQQYKRQTYHLTEQMIKDLKVIAFFEDKNISELVRNILSDYIETNKEKLETYKSKLVNK